MKKLLIMLIVCLGLCLAACSQANIAPEGNDISNGVNNIDDPENNNRENPAGKPADNEPDTTAYYGDWQVAAYLCAAPVAALSTSEIDQLVGTELAYATDIFVVNGGMLS